MNRVDGWTMPLNVLFFVISGAELDLAAVIHPATILIGVIYILARSAGKYFGADISCHLTKQSKPICDNLGITLLPQAGDCGIDARWRDGPKCGAFCGAGV